MKKFKMLIVALVVTFVSVFTVNAAEKAPEAKTFGTKNYFFANGVAITIEEPTDPANGALIKWDGGSLEVKADTTIIGGRHNDAEEVNTSITMNGGTVKNIFAGGLHISTVNESNVVLNGGKVTGAIMGGGYEELVNCGEGDFNAVDEADVMTSTTKVNAAKITVNGGSVNQVWGGGGAHAYTGSALIVINNTDTEIAYVIGGGSNGYTGTAEVIINGGKVGILQGVNRGTMDSVDMEVTGGEVKNAFVGGEPDPGVTGTIEEGTIEITGGKVENLAPGTNGVVGGTAVSAKDDVVVKFNKDAVTNVDETEFNEDNLTKTVTLKFVIDSEEYEVEHEVGTPFTEDEVDEIIAEINELKKDENKEVADFFVNQDYSSIFDMLEEVSEGQTIYVKLNEVLENDGTRNPNTADVNLFAIIISLLIGVSGLAYTIKRRKFN